MTIPLDVQYIGLSGFAGAGKDTVAGILALYQWRRAAFADPLRAALYALDPTIRAEEPPDEEWRLQYLVDCDGWDETKRNFVYVRELLQRMGTEVGRGLFGADFWIDRAFANIPEDAARVVWTDVRFPNEAAAIRSRGGHVWRVERPGFGPVNGHPSETALDNFPFDAHVHNIGDLNDLHDAVDAELTR